MNPNIADENNLYENIQLAFLIIAWFLSLIGLIKAKSFEYRYLLVGFFLLTFAFLLREMEFRDTQITGIIYYLTTPDGALYITFIVFFPYIMYSFYRISSTLPVVVAFLQTYNFYRFTLAAILLIIAGIFDRGWITSVHSLFLEEFLETIALYVYLIAMYYMLPHKKFMQYSVFYKAT